MGMEESIDEVWVSEGTNTPWREPAPAAEDDFVSEASPAPAVVATAVRLTGAPSVHRRVTAMAKAVALGAVAIGSFGVAAMGWPATPPSRVQAVPVPGHSNPLPPETRVSVTREASMPSSATPAPGVQATGGTSIAITPVSSAGEGQLRVTSTPSGARVTVNGIGWGQTPLTIEHLSPGMKSVRVTSEGYASQDRLVDLRSARPVATLHVTLTREARH
jgi:hypothetical protein